MSRRLRSWFQRIVAALLGLAVALGLAEAFLHAVDPFGISYHAWQHAFWDPVRGPTMKIEVPINGSRLTTTRLKPGFRGWYGYDLRLNELGFRGGPVAVPKPKGTYRVLFLGDSVTIGQGVPQEQTFVAIVERELKQRLAPRNADVVNASVPGWGGLDEMLYFQEMGAKLEPDLVVVVFIPNDIPDLPRPAAAPGPPESTLDRLFLHENPLCSVYLFNFVKHLYWLNQLGRGSDFERLAHIRAFDQNPDAVAAYGQILRKMVDEARTLGARFTIADALGRPYMRRFAQEMGVDYAVVLPDVDATPPGYRLSDVDAHPNPACHKFMAAKLLEQLSLP